MNNNINSSQQQQLAEEEEADKRGGHIEFIKFAVVAQPLAIINVPINNVRENINMEWIVAQFAS